MQQQQTMQELIILINKSAVPMNVITSIVISKLAMKIIIASKHPVPKNI